MKSPSHALTAGDAHLARGEAWAIRHSWSPGAILGSAVGSFKEPTRSLPGGRNRGENVRRMRLLMTKRHRLFSLRYTRGTGLGATTVRLVAKSLATGNVATMHPLKFFWLSFRHCPRTTWCEPEFPASSIPSPMPDRRPSGGRVWSTVLCGSSAYFGYTPALWNISRISRRADIRQSRILRHRRSPAGSPRSFSCVAWRGAHIRVV